MKHLIFYCPAKIRCITLAYSLVFVAVVLRGQQVFNLYDEGRIPDATKEQYVNREKIPTLTACFAANGTGEAVIICPGGGYGALAMGHEGYDIAKRFNENGITAFILKYRLPDAKMSVKPHLSPIQDLQRAIDIVRTRAAEWKVLPQKTGIIGFSAGGHLASTAGTHFHNEYIRSQAKNLRPDFMILVYPVITTDKTFTHEGSIRNLLGKKPRAELLEEFANERQITAETPPAFLVHSADDDVVPVKNSLEFAGQLAKNRVSFELHVFPQGGHGYGLKNPTTGIDWFELCIEWMKKL